MEEKIRQIKELIALQKQLNELLADYIVLQEKVAQKNTYYWRPDWSGTNPLAPQWGGLTNANFIGK